MTNRTDLDQLASQKPTGLDLHCLQRQGMSGFSRTRIKEKLEENKHFLGENIMFMYMDLGLLCLQINIILEEKRALS